MPVCHVRRSPDLAASAVSPEAQTGSLRIGVPTAEGRGDLQICCGSRVVGAEAENSHCPYLLLTADRSEAYDRPRRQSNGDAGTR